MFDTLKKARRTHNLMTDDFTLNELKGVKELMSELEVAVGHNQRYNVLLYGACMRQALHITELQFKKLLSRYNAISEAA